MGFYLESIHNGHFESLSAWYNSYLSVAETLEATGANINNLAQSVKN